MVQGVRKLVAVAGISGEIHSLEQLFRELSDAAPTRSRNKR